LLFRRKIIFRRNKKEKRKNVLTIKEISLYLEKVIKQGKPICLQLNYSGCKLENIDFAKTGFSVYVIKEQIEKIDI
jgi:hypothetical protein